jgi:hypothetical protein
MDVCWEWCEGQMLVKAAGQSGGARKEGGRRSKYFGWEQGQQESNLKLQSKGIVALPNTPPKPPLRPLLSNLVVIQPYVNIKPLL